MTQQTTVAGFTRMQVYFAWNFLVVRQSHITDLCPAVSTIITCNNQLTVTLNVTFVYLPGLVVRLNFKVNSPVYNTLGFL